MLRTSLKVPLKPKAELTLPSLADLRQTCWLATLSYLMIFQLLDIARDQDMYL